MSISTRKNSTLVAAVDIGSNSIRMVIAYISNGKIAETVCKERRSTRLAKGITIDGILSADSIDSSIDVLADYNTIIKSYKPDKVGFFATSAIREAKNSDIFLQKAKALGIDINVITGDREAFFTYIGVSSVIDIDKKAIIFDTGGGSTEFIMADSSKIISTDSYKIGVVKLVDMFNIRGDKREDILKCDSYVNNFIQEHINITEPIDDLIATAGTATTLAAIHLKLNCYSSEKINNYRLEKRYIETLFEEMIHTPINDRNRIVGLEEGREDLIIAGISITLAVMRRFNSDSLKVADYGLREGVAIYLGSLT